MRANSYSSVQYIPEYVQTHTRTILCSHTLAWQDVRSPRQIKYLVQGDQTRSAEGL